MIDFPSNMHDAARIFHDYGYHLSAWPRYLGKHIVSQQIPFWYNHSYPYHLINNKMNMGINHLLSKTCCLDVDNIILADKILKFLGLDKKTLVSNTMSWQGSGRGYKCIFKSPDVALDWLVVRFNNIPSILELRNGNFNLMVPDSIVTIYDLVPPSLHPEGTFYKFITEPLPYKNLPELPNVLLEFWQDKTMPNRIADILA